MELVKIVDARHVLSAFSDEEKISVRLAYWMAKFIAKTENEYWFYTREMQKILTTFAVTQDDNTMFIPGEKIADFNASVEALNKTDVEDPGVRFSLTELSSELNLSMKQIIPLLDFIDEEK